MAEIPLNFTEMAPRKFVPEMRTLVPLGPPLGVKFAMVGHPVGTTKLDGLDATPAGVITVTGPVEAPVGTKADMSLEVSTVKLAVTPLKRTDVAPEKFVPTISTSTPGQPVSGSSSEIVGDPVLGTVKTLELIVVPLPFVTEIGPVLAPDGTTAVIWFGELTT